MTAGVCFAYVYCYRFGFLQMEFQICLHFCVSFLGKKKKQLRDPGGQIYKVELIITIGEAHFSLHCPLPPSFPSCPHFFLLWFHLLRLKVRRQLVLADVMTRSYIQFRKQMFIQPHFTSTLSFSESRPCGNRLDQRKGWDIKKSCREPDRFYVFKKGMGVGWGWQGKKSAEQNFMGFFFVLFFQRLLCVGYSKSSIHPHPGGSSSELHAWVVLHLTAAIQ